MESFESLEDEALLAMVDKYCSQSTHNPFEASSRKFDTTVINEKMIVDKLIDLYPSSVAPQSVAILDALIYKMSAPYRHAKFWRFTRRVSKELIKLNALKLNKYLENISKDMLKSEMNYSLNVCAKQYIAAMLICRAVRSCRLRELCEQAASHCLQHIQTGHLLQSNLLLLVLNADVFHALKKDMVKIVECYDCLQPLLIDSSLLHVRRLLVATNNSFQNNTFLISSPHSFRSIAEICGIEENEYTNLLASTGTSRISKWTQRMSTYHEEDYSHHFSNRLSSHISTSSYKQLITESIILSIVIYGVIVLKFRRRKHTWLTEQQKERIIAEWKPEPLVPEISTEHSALQTHYFDGKVSKFVIYDGKEYLNLATTNFLGLIGDKTVEKKAKEAISKYGVGSCGPRHFYGTVDVHIALEKQLAEFLGCEEVVLYSYGFVTVSSAIPSYAKKGDIIYADKGVNFAIQEGLKVSRSRIEWFNHNDINDLERLLLEQAERDRKFPKLAAKTRRFMVVEGLYMNSGDLCPLPELMALKWKYKVRIFIDESLSIGVIGKTGRGVTEHFGVNVADCDMIVGSLEHALSSTGGFCAGRTFVVYHQRLCSLGYCFSASLPPLLAAAASKGLDIINNDPERLVRLRQNSKTVSVGLKEAFEGTRFTVNGDPLSPVQHVYYEGSNADEKLNVLVGEMRKRGYLLARAFYHPEESFTPKQSIRLSIQSEMSHDELTAFIEAMKEETQEIDRP